MARISSKNVAGEVIIFFTVTFRSNALLGARLQRNSSTVRRVWKHWTDEHRKTGSGRWKVSSACNDRHLLSMAVNNRTASSGQHIRLLQEV
ncbi:hypothetical protein TNCV_2912801 [Trichonephila clavipes]|nr:hypothetical protein TNCV_2912801 [Trichonephila clavipes]